MHEMVNKLCNNVPVCGLCQCFPAFCIMLKSIKINENFVLSKNCPYLEFFQSVFSRIWSEYGNVYSKFLYSVQMRVNTDQKNSEYGHFSRSACMKWADKIFVYSVQSHLSQRHIQDPKKHLMFCAIWQHLYNLKNTKNTHGGVLLLEKLQA